MSFGVVLILHGQILPMHSAHKQAMTPYKLIITQQAHYSTGNITEHRKSAINSTLKNNFFARNSFSKVIYSATGSQGTLSPFTVASFFLSNI
jgi:hypothetical protein